MSAALTSSAAPPKGAGSLAVALVPAAIVLATTALSAGLAGHPYALGEPRTYQVVMNVAVLARFFGMFVSVAVVWGVLRSRACPRWLLVVAVLSGPIAYAFTAALAAAQYFPLGQALYYGVNPMFVAAVASQCAIAALAEMVWRWWRGRRGVAPSMGRPVTWRLVAAAVAGFLILFLTVLWQGGVPYFFWYQRGYLLLFT